MKFTAEDKKLLISMGIDPEAQDADKFLVLARRIAKHKSPAQVKLDAQAAKLQLIKLALRQLLDAKKEP
jgi:hypothetical protein